MIRTFESMAWWQFITINDDKPFQHTCASAHDSWADQQRQWPMCAWAQIHMKIPLNCAPPCTTTMCSPPYTITMCSTLHRYHALQLTPLPMNPQMASSVRWSAIRCWCICRFSWQQHKIESNLLWTWKCTTTD